MKEYILHLKQWQYTILPGILEKEFDAKIKNKVFHSPTVKYFFDNFVISEDDAVMLRLKYGDKAQLEDAKEYINHLFSLAPNGRIETVYPPKAF